MVLLETEATSGLYCRIRNNLTVEITRFFAMYCLNQFFFFRRLAIKFFYSFHLSSFEVIGVTPSTTYFTYGRKRYTADASIELSTFKYPLLGFTN